MRQPSSGEAGAVVIFGVVCLGEYIALYQSQRAIMKQKHQEKEQYITMLAQDKEEMKVSHDVIQIQRYTTPSNHHIYKI